LTIAQWIVQRHGGEIVVESRQGVGTSFTLYFPLASSALLSVVEPEAPEPSVLHITVVVVDDEPLVAGAIGAMISRMGHQVRLATSGAEGVELVKRKVGDLVLVDLGMPDVDGWQVVQAVRKRWPPVPVYLFTGYEVVLDPEEAEGLRVWWQSLSPTMPWQPSLRGTLGSKSVRAPGRQSLPRVLGYQVLRLVRDYLPNGGGSLSRCVNNMKGGVSSS
jgi:CheY-like chemotaxis protein